MRCEDIFEAKPVSWLSPTAFSETALSILSLSLLMLQDFHDTGCENDENLYHLRSNASRVWSLGALFVTGKCEGNEVTRS